MKVNQWFAISKSGITRVRKQKPDLAWNEIAVKVQLDIPDELFLRPVIEATLRVDKIPNNAYRPEIIINTADLIEQQTGAKIQFRLLPPEEDKSD